MKTFKFSLVLRTRENTDVFITLDDNIYGIGIHSKRSKYPLSLSLSLSLYIYIYIYLSKKIRLDIYPVYTGVP